MRKPKYLDKARRVARAEREFWGGVKWSPTQRKDIESRAQFPSFTVANMLADFTRQRGDFGTVLQFGVYHPPPK